MEHEVDSDTNCNWCTWNNPHKIGKGTGRHGNKRTSGDSPDNSIIKISQNIEETCCHLNPSEKPSANTDGKNVQKSTNNNDNKTII